MQLQVDKGTRVEISDELVKEAYMLGKLRRKANRSCGKRNMLKSKKSPYILEGEGVCGEFAAATMLEAHDSEWLKIRQIKPRQTVEDVGDLTISDRSLDVKTSMYSAAHLIVPLYKLQSLADIYVLYTGFAGIYTFRGGIARSTIQSNLMSYTFKGEAIWIPQDSLKDWPPWAV